MDTKLEINWSAVTGVQVELGAIIARLSGGLNEVSRFASYAEVCEQAAAYGLDLYQGYLKGMPMPSGKMVKHPTGDLANHSKLESRGGFEWALVNKEKYADDIETGAKEFDMKAILKTSKKARRAKDGSLYLIIPFRHGTPGTVGLQSMPSRVYNMARTMKQSLITGFRMEQSAHGFSVKRFTYHWGDRLTSQDILAAGLSKEQARRYGNLYRFGPSAHGSYLTFRTMSEKSKGWIKPAQPGLYPAKQAVEVTFSDSAEVLNQAVAEDFSALLGMG